MINASTGLDRGKYTLDTVNDTLDTVNDTLDTANYTLDTANYTLDTANYTLDTARHGLNMSSLDMAYVAVTAVMSLMSILGCLLVLAVHWLYNDLRTTGRNMLVHLTVADLLTALGNLMGVTWYLNVERMDNKMAYCKLHSALTIMSSIASFLWTVVIAWFVFWIVIRKQPSSDQRKRRCNNIVLPFVCWGVPVLIAVVAMLKNVLGYDQHLSQASWCWIDPTIDHPLLWMLVTGKAWEVGACLGTVALYTAVKVMLFRQANKQKVALSHHSRKLDQANTKLTFVPLVFVVLRVWGSIRFLLGNVAYEYASSSQADWIVIMQGAGDSAQGIANCVIYCLFTAKIRQRLLGSCHCPILGQSKSSSTDRASSHRVPQIHHETPAGRGSNMRIPNRVVPAPAGYIQHTGSHVEEKNSSLQSFEQEQVLDKLYSHTEHLKDKHQQKHQVQSSSLAFLAEHKIVGVQQEQITVIPADTVGRNIISGSLFSHEHDETDIVLQNETESTRNTSSRSNSMSSVDAGIVSCTSKELPRQEQANSVWTTVPNLYSYGSKSVILSDTEMKFS